MEAHLAEVGAMGTAEHGIAEQGAGGLGTDEPSASTGAAELGTEASADVAEHDVAGPAEHGAATPGAAEVGICEHGAVGLSASGLGIEEASIGENKAIPGTEVSADAAEPDVAAAAEPGIANIGIAEVGNAELDTDTSAGVVDAGATDAAELAIAGVSSAESGAIEAGVPEAAEMGAAEVDAADTADSDDVQDSDSSDEDDDESSDEENPDWRTTEDVTARLQVFLVTFAAVLAQTAEQEASETPLRTLDDVTREAIRDAILDAVANPILEQPHGGRPTTNTLKAVKLVVFLEQPKHFHVALKVTPKTRFLPLKLALRRRSGLASHWSTSHSEWWSAVRYGVFTTEKKVAVDPEPLPWAASGAKLNLYEESQQPFNAVALKRHREVAAARAAGEAAAAGKKLKGEKFSNLDFKTLALAEGLTTPNAVMEYVQQKGSAVMQAFVSTNQRHLKELLEEAAAWSNAAALAAAERESEWQVIERLAGKPCTCSNGMACSWEPAVRGFFARNSQTIDEEWFAACLAKVMNDGPGKQSRVPLLVGVTNAGKSTVLDSLDSVFGPDEVFHTPALGATMPLANLAVKRKRFIYFDDFQPVVFASTPHRNPCFPVVTFLKLFAGQHLEIQVPMNSNKGNVDIAWKKGAAITAKFEGLWEPSARVSAEDVRHMKSRVEQFEAHAKVPEAAMRVVSPCPTAFCKWLLTRSSAFASRRVLSLGEAPGPAPELGPLPVLDDQQEQVEGLDSLFSLARIPLRLSKAFTEELLAMGAVHASELENDAWPTLNAWQSLKPLEQRRLRRALDDMRA